VVVAALLAACATFSAVPGAARAGEESGLRPGDAGWPERATPGGDGQLLEDARHTVRVASLVIEGRVERLCLPSPRVEVSVATALKGSASSGQLTVDLAKAPLGRWPREGERSILCLDGAASDGYGLSGFHASILPSTRSTLRTVRGWLAERKPTPPPPNPYAGAVAASETILTGTLGNVRPCRGRGSAATGTFRVEGSVLGYSGYSAPIITCFPALRQAEPSSSSVEPGAEGEADLPDPGRYLLFLKGNLKGNGFTVVDAVRLTDAAAEAKATRQSLAALRRAQGDGTFTTIQATLAEWQDSWNAGDLDRCIRCYSGRNPLRERYEAGGETREELAAQLGGFRGKVRLSIRAIRRSIAPSPKDRARRGGPPSLLGSYEGPPPSLPAPRAASRQAGVDLAKEGGGETEGEKGLSPPGTADVEVDVVLSTRDLVDHRRATMKLVREGGSPTGAGEWLILDEGF
jgi:hypothetical protein